MVATSTPAKKLLEPKNSLITKLKADYPNFIFKPGSQDHWSPKNNTITYDTKESKEKLNYGVLHELAHAQLGHSNYQTDFELLKMEAMAWELAAKIAKKYDIRIKDDHIQNCLDTYRDWLYARSTCPTCGVHSLQKNAKTYECFNCHSVWSVSHERFVRPYRLSK